MKNRNIRCIEINRKGNGKQIVGTKNRNIRCIEMSDRLRNSYDSFRRTVTLDVLKYVLSGNTFMKSVWKNRNIRCIEMEELIVEMADLV